MMVTATRTRIRGLSLLLTGALALCAAAVARVTDPPPAQTMPPPNTPEVKAILDRFVEVTGGRKAYDAVRNRVIKGKIVLLDKGVEISFASYHAKPRESYMVMESKPFGKSEKGTTGSTAWEVGPEGAKLLSGKERDAMLREAVLDKLAHWRSFYDKAYLMGGGTVSGKECNMVVLAPKEGIADSFFFEKESGLAVMSQSGVESAQGVVSILSKLSNYKKVGGLLLPFTAELSVKDDKRLLQIESIEQNVNLPADRFSPPAAVKALLPKKPPAKKQAPVGK